MNTYKIIVKHCQYHGALTINLTSIKKTGNHNSISLYCIYCKRMRAKEYKSKIGVKEKQKIAMKKWRLKNRENYNLKQRIKNVKNSKNLTDFYIKSLLKNNGYKKENITQEIINIKREEIKSKRAKEKLK